MSDNNPNLLLSGILKISLGIIIFGIISIILIILYTQKYIAENLNYYECKRYVIPFISFFDSKRTSADQMKKCSERNKDKYFSAVNQQIRETTNSLVESGKELAEGVNLLTMSAELAGDVTANKLDESNKHLSVIEVIMHYSLMKLKAFFDKLSALVQNAYFALLSIMDAVNVIFVIPDLIMKILAFLIMTIGLVLALLIFFFVLNHALGISLMSLGFSLLSNPFTAAFGAALLANGTFILNMIAIFIYLSAITITMTFLGVILAAYVPLKQSFDSANKSSYCCFSGSTLFKIKTENKKLKYEKIASISLNSKLYNHINDDTNYVIGKLYINETIDSINPNDYIIVYHDNMSFYDIVYKTHPIKNKNGIFVPVNNMIDNEKYKTISSFDDLKQSKFISEILMFKGKFCLVTSQNYLYSITDHFYKDFQEYPSCSSFAFLEAKNQLIKLNCNTSILNNICQNKEYMEISLGFLENTTIPTVVNDKIIYKKIKDIEINDYIFVQNDFTPKSLNIILPNQLMFVNKNKINKQNKSRIIGKYKCLSSKYCMGKISFFGTNEIIIPGHQIIYDYFSKTYIKAYMHSHYKYLTSDEYDEYILNKNELYHIILEEKNKTFLIYNQLNYIFVKDFICK